jgi:hypothetical protein
MRRRLGLGLTATVLLAACSAGSAVTPLAAPSQAVLEAPAGPSLPACANAGLALAAPPGFPVTFPLPPGAVIIGADEPPGGGSRLTFMAPIDVPALGAFLEDELPAAGFSIGGGEAEADELESKFSGAGLDGQLIAREVAGCPGVLRVQVVTRAT